MRKFLIANLEKGNGTITEEQVIELGGEVTADVVTEAEAQAMADATTQLDELRLQRFRATIQFLGSIVAYGNAQFSGNVNMASATAVVVPNVSTDLFSAVNLGALNKATRIESTRTLSPNTNFTTSELIEGLPQYGKEINLQNTTNIEITVDSASFQSYFKGGTGNIKFVAGAGRTLKLMETGKDTINGITGSFAKVKSFGTVDHIYISNY